MKPLVQQPGRALSRSQVPRRSLKQVATRVLDPGCLGTGDRVATDEPLVVELTPAGSAAEEDHPELPRTVRGLPVVACSLHSQVAPVCAGLGPDLRVAYVQLPGGALPVPLSDAVRALRAAGYLRTTVAVGPGLAGELARVSARGATQCSSHHRGHL